MALVSFKHGSFLTMEIMARTVLITFILITVIGFSVSSFPFPVISPGLCKVNEYYDPVCIKCKKCGSMRKEPEQESFQRIAPDGSSCMCKARYYLEEKKSPHNILCKLCPDRKVTSLDGWSCVSCPNDMFNETSGTCEPCIGGIAVEQKNDQFCVTCRKNTVIDSGPPVCKNCPFGSELSHDKCICPSNMTFSGGLCLPTIKLLENKPSLFTVNFESGIQVRSAFFVEHFHAAHYNCKENHNNTACQVLANMCIMLQYRFDAFFAEEDACSEHLSLIRKRPGECHVNGKSFGLWLYYINDDAKSELSRTNVPNEFISNPDLEGSKLHILAMKYSVNGTFLHMSKLRSDELQLCRSFGSEDDLAFTFGTRLQKKCKTRVRDIWDNAELIFYDLFLGYDINSNKSKMYPIPVLIHGIRKNNELVNKGPDMSKWQLVRRFFITDPVSGIEAGSSIRAKDNQPLAKILRYAADISLKIVLRNEGAPGSIYPPLLTITYAEVTSEDYIRNLTVPVSFSVSYEMDQSEANQNISIALGVLSALCFLWSTFQTWGWSKRAGKQVVDILTLGKFLIFMCGNLATVFFVVVFCASLNWFVIFKKQDVVHLLLPTSKQEKFLSIYLSIAFVMKTLQVIHLLVIQCTVDIFFIDWERPHLRTSTIASRSSSVTGSKSAAESVSDAMPGETKAITGSASKGTPDKLTSELAGVSIWRTYFVANEWAEIQSSRKMSLSLQLFGTLFFLKVVGFENLAVASPAFGLSSSELNENVPFSATCRFALGAAVYMCIALVQVAARKVFYERFVEDKLQQFVDLCSVSNVSVFIMVTRRYGYYIHGRSAHGRADVNMKEMHELLRREEEDLCGHRGLLPNTEQQTFQMALPSGVHDQFQRLLIPLTTYSQAADRMQGVGGHLFKVDIDRVVHTYQMLNKFLSGFIEHAFKDLDYIVKDKVLLENLLDVECYEASDRGYFYNDSGHSFDSVLLFGHETTLLVFDVLMFSIIDLAACDYTLAAVLTFLIGKAVQGLRQSAGRRNLVRKALVDERFLT